MVETLQRDELPGEQNRAEEKLITLGQKQERFGEKKDQQERNGNEVSSLRRLIEEATRALKEEREKQKTFEAQRTAKTVEKTGLETERSGLEKQTTSLRGEIGNRNKIIEAKKAELNSGGGARVSSAEDTPENTTFISADTPNNEKLQGEIATLEAQNRAAQAEVQNIENTIKALAVKIKILETEIQQLTSNINLSAQNITRIEEENTPRISKLTKLEEEQEKLSREIAKLTDSIEKDQKDVTRIERSILASQRVQQEHESIEKPEAERADTEYLAEFNGVLA